MYQRILVPTDGSELSGRAVAAGVGLAKALGAEVHTLCVKEPFPTAPWRRCSRRRRRSSSTPRNDRRHDTSGR